MSKVTGRMNFPFSRAGNYHIRVLGLLDDNGVGKLGSLRIVASSIENKEGLVTELVGKMRDQAELAGVLNSLYEMHLTLLSVKYLDEK